MRLSGTYRWVVLIKCHRCKGLLGNRGTRAGRRLAATTAHILACLPTKTLVQEDGSQPPLRMCLLDNRGTGGSSCPKNKKDYSTEIMAADVKAVMVRLLSCSC